jgi:hypothetical protein
LVFRTDAAHRVHRVDGQHDHRRHLDDELDEVGPEDGPHARRHRVEQGDEEADADRDHLAADGDAADRDVPQPQGDGEDLDHRPGDPAEDDQVDGERQVEGAEPAQEGGGAAAVA